MRARLLPLPLLLFACGEDPAEPGAPGASILAVAPMGFTFGEVRDPCARPELRFCFENRGGAVTLDALELVRTPADAPLSIAGVEGAPSSAVAGTKLEPGARLCANVRYAPTAAGLHAASLELRIAGTAAPFAIMMSGSAEVERSIVEDFSGDVVELDLLLIADGRVTTQDTQQVVRGELAAMVHRLGQALRLRVFTVDPLFPDAPNLLQLPEDPTPEMLMPPAYAGALPNQGLLAMANLFLQRGPLAANRTLLVVFVSTEDDASPGPPELYPAFVSRLYSSGQTPPGAYFASFVLFEPAAICQTETLQGTPGLRYNRAMAAALGSVLHLCTSGWASSLQLRPLPAQLRLRTRARADSVRVSIVLGGDEQPYGGYLFDEGSNSLLWSGAELPAAGALVRVRYEAACL